MSSARREVRKQILILVVSILAVHSVAIGLDRIYGFRDGDPGARRTFTAIWMVASVVVVLVGLYRIRVARNAAARERP